MFRLLLCLCGTKISFGLNLFCSCLMFILFVSYVFGLSNFFSLCILMCGLRYVLVFVLNGFEASIMVGSMCLCVVSKSLDLVLPLCIVVNECTSVVLVEIGMALLLSSWYVNVLILIFFFGFVFVFKMLLILLKSLLIPHPFIYMYVGVLFIGMVINLSSHVCGFKLCCGVSKECDF